MSLAGGGKRGGGGGAGAHRCCGSPVLLLWLRIGTRRWDGCWGSRSLGVLAMSKSEMGRRACDAQRRSESAARAEAGAGLAPQDGSGVAPASWWRVLSSESLPGVGGPTPSGLASLLPFA